MNSRLLEKDTQTSQDFSLQNPPPRQMPQEETENEKHHNQNRHGGQENPALFPEAPAQQLAKPMTNARSAAQVFQPAATRRGAIKFAHGRRHSPHLPASNRAVRLD